MRREHHCTQCHPSPRCACVPNVHQQVRVPGQEGLPSAISGNYLVRHPGTMETIRRSAPAQAPHSHDAAPKERRKLR
jgi:hypothetical protein